MKSAVIFVFCVASFFASSNGIPTATEGACGKENVLCDWTSPCCPGLECKPYFRVNYCKKPSLEVAVGQNQNCPPDGAACDFSENSCCPGSYCRFMGWDRFECRKKPTETAQNTCAKSRESCIDINCCHGLYCDPVGLGKICLITKASSSI
jgi:hypothetical protein